MLPAFVFKWLKDTSATGFIRFGQSPNKRVQDGYKQPWLCLACEKRFNVWETQFATNIFHPLNEDGGKRLQYGDWLLKFCVSVSWRVLFMMLENEWLDKFSEIQKKTAKEALKTWSQFLLGKIPHPGLFEQHFLPLDAIEGSTTNNLPANINRYILRTVDIDAVRNDTIAYMFAKMGKFIILGFIELTYPKQWVGTKVHVREGVVGRGSFTVPEQFGSYLADKARRFAEIHANISETQREKINETMWKNLDRVSKSSTLEAMKHDVELFGQATFDIHKQKPNSNSDD